MAKGSQKPAAALLQVLATASPAEIERCFRDQAAKHLAQQRWLSVAGRYSEDTASRFSDDVESGKSLDVKSISEYVAVSAPAHVIDGWTLLARAIESLLRGSPATAVHLAYYAELRAACSLLATQGVGVLNNHHPVVQGQGSVAAVNGGTHKVCWEALALCSSASRMRESVLSSINVGGASIWSWLSAFMGGGNAPAVGTRWLTAWGLDLKRLSDDRAARNEASYRPEVFRPAPSVSTRDAARFVESLWRLFQPSTRGSFPSIDKCLLRRAVELAFYGIRGVAPVDDLPKFGAEVDAMLVQMPLSDVDRASLRRYLLRQDVAHDPTPLDLAEKSTASDDAELATHVVSRAALLLRLATAATSKVARIAAVDAAAMKFWTSKFGIARGIWADGREPMDVGDVWMDIEASLDESASWLKRGQDTLRDLADSSPGAFARLGAFDVVALWGLAS